LKNEKKVILQIAAKNYLCISVAAKYKSINGSNLVNKIYDGLILAEKKTYCLFYHLDRELCLEHRTKYDV
jgi:hypothetical protein